MLADVGSAEEPDVFQKHTLQEFPDFETDAQLPLVLFQDRESLSCNLKSGMAKRPGFGRAGKGETNFPKAS